jgi:hypothetical protein
MTVEQAQAALKDFVRQDLIPDLDSQDDRDVAARDLDRPSTLATKAMALGMFYGLAVKERFKRYEKRREGGWEGLVLGKASNGPGIVHENWIPKFELAMRCDPKRAEQALEAHGSHSMFVGWLFTIKESSDPWVHDRGGFLYQWGRVVPLPESCFLFCNHSLRTDASFLSPDEYVYAVRLLVGLPISANLEESVRRAGLFKRQQYTDLRTIVQPQNSLQACSQNHSRFVTPT